MDRIHDRCVAHVISTAQQSLCPCGEIGIFRQVRIFREKLTEQIRILLAECGRSVRAVLAEVDKEHIHPADQGVERFAVEYILIELLVIFEHIRADDLLAEIVRRSGCHLDPIDAVEIRERNRYARRGGVTMQKLSVSEHPRAEGRLGLRRKSGTEDLA